MLDETTVVTGAVNVTGGTRTAHIVFILLLILGMSKLYTWFSNILRPVDRTTRAITA